MPTSSKAGNYTLAPFPNDPSILGVPAIAPSNSSRSISPQLAQLPNDPSIIMAKKPDFRPQNVGEGRDARGITIPESRSTTSEYVQKPRPAINSLFAGNLPTSVLRQLSTKSTDTSSRHSSSTSSPMFNKLHPVASKVSSNVPLASTNAILSPPLSMAPIPPPLQQGGQFSQSPGYYQRLPPQALSSQSLSAVHNHPTDVSQQAIGRNIPVDQFLGMAGPPLSHMRNPSPLPLHLQHQQLPRGSIQGGPMPPIHMFQQQQFDRFPPHMLPPGPLQLPGPGPLLPHLQHGGGMQSRLPMHPDMMPPPDMLQASMAGYANMIPPNLMNSGK
ncbi:hypothetical protein BC936DRAFT_143135 [Jimgerdemannia flammicorona]|uniref:Uncharacterized protein n=1 Tax=Jimgerdemannia flammicorona TaxID=994334 RepID=A0A432ZZA6_9FUNG|nr:hypothetical protein BC936DRAFT_143135 [Jimgerdemannia flammicorona]